MRRFFSTTLGQILAIIATSSALTFLLFIGLLAMLDPGGPPPPFWPWQPVYRITNLVDGLKAVPRGEWNAVMAAFQRPDMPSIRLTQAPVLCAARTGDTHSLEAALKSEFAKTKKDVEIRSCQPDDTDNSVQVVLRFDDQTLDIRIDKGNSRPPRISFPVMASVLFLCVAVAGMSAWAVWLVIRPLRRLSAKADSFGRDISISPIAEEGPLEIRSAARAFNLMQQRVTRSMQDRTRTLAAISHDLRTPLTRMRLQLDAGSREIDRGKLLRDIGLMQSMVSSALAFLSGGFDREEKEWFDLGALLSTLSDEYEEAGVSVSYDGPAQIRCFCRPTAITRALTNLVENAAHFGSTVVISAATDADIVAIEVADDGPGIPRDRFQDVIEPFVRLDPARSSRPGSVGLGLSIVKEIIEGHGGTLELAERQPSGLVARLRFPMTAEAPEALMDPRNRRLLDR
ncbi:Adaptive-response sensory-kinase SasA [Labrys miyagiensis]